MIYKAIDRWNNPCLEHKDHKYIAREKINGTYRYFYDQDEYEAYLRGSGKLKGDGITGELKGDQARKNREHATLGVDTMYVDSPNKLYSKPQSSTGLKKPTDYAEMMTGGNFRSDAFVTPKVDSRDPDPRWAINQSYKPKATASEKAKQAVKNKKAKVKNKITSRVNSAQKWVQGFFNKG